MRDVMEKMDLQSKNQFQYNIEKLGQQFPELITEVKNDDGKITRAINYDKVSVLFGEYADSWGGGTL